MAIKVHVDIVSAEKELFSGLAEMVVATASWARWAFCRGTARSWRV